MRIRPARGRVLVRPVETEETLPGGRIFIPDQARERFASHQVQIVAVGEPEICEDEDCGRDHRPQFARGVSSGFAPATHRLVHPVQSGLTKGAWAIVQPRSFVPAGHDGEKLYFVRQADILGLFVFRPDDETKPGN